MTQSIESFTKLKTLSFPILYFRVLMFMLLRLLTFRALCLRQQYDTSVDTFQEEKKLDIYPI